MAIHLKNPETVVRPILLMLLFALTKGLKPSTDDVENEMIDLAQSTKRAVALISCLPPKVKEKNIK